MNLTTLKRKPIPRATRWFAAAALGGMLSASAVAAETSMNPYAMADDTWITISGTVENVQADAFTLDYGPGTIIVEMDDGDRDADAYKLLDGDNVTVSGKIDDDFFETTTIEAGSVFVENIGTTFFSSSLDEETRGQLEWNVLPPVVVSQTVVKGTVTQVMDEEFTVNTGPLTITVDVDEMAYNPLDDEGYQKIAVGDRVKVTGTMENELFEGRELEADTVVKLWTEAS